MSDQNARYQIELIRGEGIHAIVDTQTGRRVELRELCDAMNQVAQAERHISARLGELNHEATCLLQDAEDADDSGTESAQIGVAEIRRLENELTAILKVLRGEQ